MSTTDSVAALCGTALLVLLTSCTSGASPQDVDTPSPETSGSSTTTGGPSYPRYVALGDSYTAGPYVPDTDLADGCLRSSGNYPSLVAERLDVESFVDVSCSAADTRDLVRPQRTFQDGTVPPQLDAVTEDTDLVTLGIGANDLGLFGTLVSTCIRVRAIDPTGSPCGDYLDQEGTDLRRQIRRIGDHIATAIARIRARAPEATVLLVGYPRLTPTKGTCPRLLPLAPGDYRLAGDIARSLSEAMGRAASRAGVGFIDLYTASRGHDICAEDPWVNGKVTDQTAALAFHPFDVQMEAVADLIAGQVG